MADLCLRPKVCGYWKGMGIIMAMDIKEIMEIIPHRQPFLLIDRIEEIKEGESVTAIKNVTYNEPFFAGHFPSEPVMPGVLVVEAMAQAGAVAILSMEDFKGRGFFNIIFMITMFFGGGLIPTYLIVSNLGLVDSMWAVILPGAFSVWNMTIARTYYKGIPQELREAADVDGASELTFFFKILLPVCTPVIAVLVLWQFVAMWNSYFDAMIYLNDSAKQPLQLVLRSILIQNQPESGMIADMQSTAARA